MALGLYELINNINKQIKAICCKVNALLDSGAGSYKVYTALLTQSGGDSVNYIYSEDTNRNLTIGVTYLIGDNTGGADFTNVGAPNNSSGTYFVATGTSAASWGNGDYVDLSYNTGAPVVTVLENTIGNIWFTYNTIGQYGVNSNSLFISNKTISNISPNFIYESADVPYIVYVGGIAQSLFYLNSYVASRFASEVPSDDIIGNVLQYYLEIRVYN